MSSYRTLVNGSATDRIDPLDRGFALGDGLFETIAVERGTVTRWSLHRQRMQVGCERLRLPQPDDALLMREAERIISGEEHGILRITLTRGVGARGYAPPADPTPTRVLGFASRESPLHPGNPVRLRTCSHRLAIQPTLAGIKHLNRLEQILARAEWSDSNIADGLLYDSEGTLVEATASNVFLVEGGRLKTPRLDRCGVAGILRSCILELADRLGINTTVERLDHTDVARADEIFISNTVFGIRPVGWLDDRPMPAPGPLTQRLVDALPGATQSHFRNE